MGNIEDIIKIENLGFSYPGEQKKAVSNISLSVAEGEFIVLCGKSGCGKSTLLKHLKPPLAPAGRREGRILFQNKKLEELTERQQALAIGFVRQDPDNQIVTDKVWHELAFGLENLGYPSSEIRIRVAEMASYFGIQGWFHRNVTELSGGQKQLLNLASIMAMHPQLLILDEPTSQLDPVAAGNFLETVKKLHRDLGLTVLLTEHRLEEVLPSADRVIVMEDGQIAAEGSPTAVGRWLKENKHVMFRSMPVPMQIYAMTESMEECPVTVRDGRRWLETECLGRGILPAQTDDFAKRSGAKDKKRRKSGQKAESRQRPAAAEFRDVWFRYEKDAPDVICGMNMTVFEGEFFCLLGGNGSGKTTALSLLCRLNRPWRGKILLRGKALETYSDRELFQNYLGVMPQNPQSLFVKKTVREELYEMIGGESERKSREYHIEMQKSEAVEGIARVTCLEQLMHRHPYDLSGGEQQRLALAKILLLRPKLLLMDEPTKGMDGGYKEEFAEILDLLKNSGVTIFMISHDIEFCAAHADRCGLIFDGALAAAAEPGHFFPGNNFYTTQANRMARKYFPDAVTGRDVIQCLRKNEIHRQ